MAGCRTVPRRRSAPPQDDIRGQRQSLARAVWLIAVTLVASVAEIAPSRVRRFDQADLLFPTPAFHFFLPSDCSKHQRVSLEIDERRDVVLRGEPAKDVSFVLENSLLKRTSDSDVQHATLTRENVNVVNLVHADSVTRPGNRTSVMDVTCPL